MSNYYINQTYKYLFIMMLIAIAVVAVSIWITSAVSMRFIMAEEAGRGELLQKSWSFYKSEYIRQGRVVRPKNDYDTVSEGQAYAMLRALWMNDKETFDKVYRWTEANLSRLEKFDDNLLAWQYGMTDNGGQAVIDWTPATDADLDYALALFFAEIKWQRGPEFDLPPYHVKARHIAGDLQEHAVIRLPNDELVLLPWNRETLNREKHEQESILVNPSYFSPGHYAVFASITGDARWMELREDTYAQIERLLSGMGDVEGVGLAPDWCRIEPDGSFVPDPERGTASSWDAFRIWWRLRMDHLLTGNATPLRLINDNLVVFLEDQIGTNQGAIYMEYDYGGAPIKEFESPARLGAYAWTLHGVAPDITNILRGRLGVYRRETGDGIYFYDRDDYYVNSWAWFGDAMHEHHFSFERY